MINVLQLVLIAIAFVAIGCDSSNQTESAKQKAPRPVSTISLHTTRPQSSKTITGSVGAWKTEQIGFEISGRVQQVIEPDTDIEGRILDSTGKILVVPGTVIAELHDDRYQVAVNSAQASVGVAKRRMEAIEVEINEGIPARLESAKAEQLLAQAEFGRTKRVFEQKFVSQSEYDKAAAELATAGAAVANVQAELKARQAELKSREAEVSQAENQLAEAQLDLRDTTLYSSFRGQIAEVHVVSGSHVEAGDPVVTVQMMDPIKVEIEVSSAMSRHYRFGDTIRIYAPGTDNKGVELSGFVYTTDPVADPQTRTFTVALLVRNQKTIQAIPEKLEAENIACTEELWTLNIGSLIGGGESLMIEESAIRHDSQGSFLWKTTNRYIGDVSQDSSRILNVTKTRVTTGDLRLPFLNWVFVPLTITNGDSINPERDMFAGAITVTDGKTGLWEGQHILLDKSSWLLRPGDMVRVSQTSGKLASGFYVPMRAVRHDSGKTYVFVAEDSQAQETIARRIEVQLADTGHSLSGKTTLRRIEPVGDAQLLPDTQLIVEGVHFLADGDSVALIERRESGR